MDLRHLPPYVDVFEENQVAVFYKLTEEIITDYINHCRRDNVPISLPDFAVGLLYRIGYQDGQTEIVTLKPGMWEQGQREGKDE